MLAHPIQSGGAWIMDFHVVSGNSMDHEHQHGLGQVLQLPMSTWPLAAAGPTDIIMASCISADLGHPHNLR